MSSPVDCYCSPCASQTPPVQVPGIAGKNATSVVTADILVPAVNGSVGVTVTDTSWMVVGQIIIIGQGGGNVLANPGPGTFKVGSIFDSTTLALTFLGYAGDVAVGATISAGAIVSPGYSGVGIITGSAVLVAGTVTVTAPITAKSIILATRRTSGGTPGNLSCPTSGRTVGASFTIVSTSNTETSSVDYAVFG